MSPWNNVVFDEEDPMAQTVLRVMQVVYRHFDPFHQPAEIDPWLFSPSLSYQVDEGSSEPSIIILNLREGLPDYLAMNTHFMINLNTSRIHDKFKDIRFPCPVEITSELEELRHIVRSEVARKNHERKMAITQQRVRFKERLEAYYIRLADKKIIDLNSIDGPEGLPDQQWYGKCPLHEQGWDTARLISCLGCGMVSCSGHCDGFYMDDFQCCELHPCVAYCPTCRSGEDCTANLIMCPGSLCGGVMYCRKDLQWCMGPPSATLTVSGDSESKTTYMRSHAPVPIPCEICMDIASEVDCSLPVLCANDDCWSGGKLLCDSCGEGGVSCLKCSMWICEECEAASGQDILWKCRKCEEAYCYDCRKMDPCVGCGVTGLCHECSANGEDDTPDDEWECEACNNQMCGRCVDEGFPTACESCGKSVCGHCTVGEECLTCRTG